MKAWLSWLWVWWLSVSLAGAAGAEPTGGGWLPEAALSRLMLRTLVQAPDGMLWVGTDDGVYRFDGTELLPLNVLRRRGPALPTVACNHLLPLPDGQLWLGTEAGLFRFSPDGTLQALPLAGSSNRFIDGLQLAADGRNVWVNQNQVGLRSYSLAGQPNGPLLPQPGTLRSLWPAPDGTLWLTDEQDARHLDARGHLLGAWALPTHGHLRAVYDPAGRPWLLSNGTAYRPEAGGQLRPVLRWASELPDKDLDVLPLPGGLALLRPDQIQQLEWTTGPTPRLQLRQAVPLPPWPTANWRGHLLADPAGRWWVFDTGTRGCWYRAAAPTFIHSLPGPGGQPYSVRAMARLPNGRLLVSTYSGILTQAPDSPLAPLRPWREARLPTGNAPVLLGIVPRPLGPGGDWLAVGAFPLLRFQPHTGRFLHLVATDQVQPDIGMNALHYDSLSGRVWAGSRLGLYLYDARRQTFRPYQPPTAPRGAAPPLAGRVVEDVAADARGYLWLATPEGVERLTLADGRRLSYSPAAPAPRRAPLDGARCLYLAPDGRLWVGTRSHGLAVIEPDGRVRMALTPQQGLPNGSLATIMPSAGGYLWLGTYQGVVRFQPATRQLAVFTTVHGLASDECNARAAYHDPADGSLLIGGVAGLNRIRPEQVPSRQVARPRLRLASLAALSASAEASRPRYLLAPDALPALHLAPDAPLIDLHLALPNAPDPSRARYAYRVRGWLSDRWLGLGTTPQLRLQGLPPGRYTLEVRGETGQGVPAVNVLRLPLTVTAAWWNRPSTWVLAALLAVAAVYLWQRSRLQRVRRENALRARLAADLHDEVGALLTRVTMQAELLRELAQGPPARLAALVDDSRAAASTVRDIIWSVDAGADTLAALVDRMRDHLEATARATGRDLRLDTSGLPDSLHQSLPPTVRQHVYLIFKEALTNALKYARPDTPIDVTLSYASPLELRVTNQGEAALTSRAGQGLRNMQQRAALLRAELTAGPVPGGWQVRLSVPG